MQAAAWMVLLLSSLALASNTKPLSPGLSPMFLEKHLKRPNPSRDDDSAKRYKPDVIQNCANGAKGQLFNASSQEASACCIEQPLTFSPFKSYDAVDEQSENAVTKKGRPINTFERRGSIEKLASFMKRSPRVLSGLNLKA